MSTTDPTPPVDPSQFGPDRPRPYVDEAVIARLSPQTRAVRAGHSRSTFDETSEALYLNSGYVYESAAEAEAAFNGDLDRFVYSRYGNPTVAMFEERLAAIEGGESCYATASGMAAVFIALGGLCAAGDRIVASRALFGSCFVVVNEVLPRWGVTTTFVDGHDLDQWREALSTPAAAVFFETPSNPMQELVDIAAVSELAHAAGAQVVVDNAFGNPVHSHPLAHGADVVVYSTTKHVDGQGRTQGGAIIGRSEYIHGEVENLIRNIGPTLAPFNAWVQLKSLETMHLRLGAMAESALALATFFESHPAVESVRYPLLPSHPQYELAKRQMEGGGTIVTLALKGGKDAAFAFMDALTLIDISNNFADSKSLISHPSTTTHRRLSEEDQLAVGITPGTVRLSVGLEATADLQADLKAALDRLS